MKIPTVSPGELQLRTTSPNVSRTKIDTQGEGLEILGKTIKNIADERYRKLDEARNFTEMSQYESFKIRKTAELRVQAENDTYTDPEGRIWGKTGKPEDFKPYREALRKGREEAGQFFTNKEQQEKAMADWDLHAIETENAISATFMKNIAINGDVVTREALKELSDAYDGSEAVKKAIETTINQAAANHIYNPKQAYVLKEDTLKEAKDNFFLRDLNTNPAIAEEKLKTNAYDFDIVELKNARSIYDTDIQKIRNQNEEAVIDSYLKNELTPEIVRSLRDQKKIDANFAVSMIATLNKPPSIKTDFKTYDDIMIHMTNGDMSGTAIRTMILTSRNKLSDTDFQHLLYVEKIGGLETPTEAYAREEKELARQANRPKSTFWKTVWQNTKAAFPFAANFVMANIINRIQQENVQDEQIVNIANDEIRKQNLKDNNWMSTLPEKGKLCRDKYGNTAIIYPDGSYEEVMAGTGEFIHKEQRTKKKQGEQ